MIDWDKEFENQARSEAASYDAKKSATKREEEFQRGVRLGWWDEKGNLIPQEVDADDEEE